MRRPRRAALTSMFLQATFFTTAGNRSEAFFPRAIIWAEGQGRGRKGRERASTQQRRSTGDQDSLTLGPPPPGKARPLLPPLTATILFMASSLRESLLVSSISFKSSCLEGALGVS